MMEAEAGDEKDKRIRELEETLRKQKELMEILQRKLNDTPSSVWSWSLRYSNPKYCLGDC